jgi:uncharacterized protein (TIGR02996 family)
MTPEAAFLHDILLHPEDDGPRLIYADALEDRGDPRGELIRLQCQLDRLEQGDSQGPALRQRAHALLRQHRGSWLGFLGEGSDTCWRFRRGFLDEVCLEAAVFLHRAGELFRLAPLLRHLRLWGARRCLSDLAASPHLAQLSTLDLTANKIGDEGVKALVASPHLAQLTTLLLARNEIGQDGGQWLASSPHLARLSTLDLTSNTIGATGAQALAASPHLTQLTTLRLVLNRIGAAGAQALASSPYLVRLSTLDLDSNEIGDEGAGALAASPPLARLATLVLAGNEITATGAQALAASPHLTHLSTLDLSHNEIDDDGARALAVSPHLGRLSTLRLSSSWIGDTGAQALAASPHLAGLRTLDLAGNKISEAVVRALTVSPHLARLSSLNLAGNETGDVNAANLRREEEVRAIRASLTSSLTLTDRVEVYLLDPASGATGGVGVSGRRAQEPRDSRDEGAGRRAGGPAGRPVVEHPVRGRGQPGPLSPPHLRAAVLRRRVDAVRDQPVLGVQQLLAIIGISIVLDGSSRWVSARAVRPGCRPAPARPRAAPPDARGLRGAGVQAPLQPGQSRAEAGVIDPQQEVAAVPCTNQ